MYVIGLANKHKRERSIIHIRGREKPVNYHECMWNQWGTDTSCLNPPKRLSVGHPRSSLQTTTTKATTKQGNVWLLAIVPCLRITGLHVHLQA